MINQTLTIRNGLKNRPSKNISRLFGLYPVNAQILTQPAPELTSGGRLKRGGQEFLPCSPWIQVIMNRMHL